MPRAASACAAAGAPLDPAPRSDADRARADRVGERRAYRTYSAYARAVARVLEDEPIEPLRARAAGPVARGSPPTLPDVPELGRDGVGREPPPRAVRPRGSRRSGAGGTAASRATPRTATTSGVRDATSRLSPYLKLGMLSPRRCARVARRPGRGSGRPSCSGATGSSTSCTTIQTSPSAPVDPRYERVPVARRRCRLRGLVPGRDRIRPRRRRHAPARRGGLPAEPRAHGLRELPLQAPARRLAARRALVPLRTSSTATCRRTRAAGSGSRAPGSTRRPTSAS